MATIHPTAIVEPSVKLADDVTIGPYCVVEGDVERNGITRGAEPVLEAHA